MGCVGASYAMRFGRARGVRGLYCTCAGSHVGCCGGAGGACSPGTLSPACGLYDGSDSSSRVGTTASVVPRTGGQVPAVRLHKLGHDRRIHPRKHAFELGHLGRIRLRGHGRCFTGYRRSRFGHACFAGGSVTCCDWLVGRKRPAQGGCFGRAHWLVWSGVWRSCHCVCWRRHRFLVLLSNSAQRLLFLGLCLPHVTNCRHGRANQWAAAYVNGSVHAGMHVSIVSNPVAGEGHAHRLVDAVRDRLRRGGVTEIADFRTTEATYGAKRIGANFAADATGPLTVVVVGGDGTVHELLEGMASGPHIHPVSLVVVPTGTANALYASYCRPDLGTDDTWRWKSIDAFLAHAQPRPLTMLDVDVSGHAPHLACVVASHALHAAILRDSESLRTEHPGLERFKMAAEQNSTRWCDATVQLTTPAQKYDPRTAAFVAVPEDETVLDGPFLYMNAMVVDRLEPEFVPAPFAVCGDPELQRPPTQMDVVIVRPMRSPTLKAAASVGDKERIAFAQGPLTQVLFEGMYRHGRHVGFTFSDGYTIEDHGAGPWIVEYYRTTGYTWQPASSDEQARTTCIDGTVVDGPTARVHVASRTPVSLWA